MFFWTFPNDLHPYRPWWRASERARVSGLSAREGGLSVLLVHSFWRLLCLAVSWSTHTGLDFPVSLPLCKTAEGWPALEGLGTSVSCLETQVTHPSSSRESLQFHWWFGQLGPHRALCMALSLKQAVSGSKGKFGRGGRDQLWIAVIKNNLWGTRGTRWPSLTLYLQPKLEKLDSMIVLWRRKWQPTLVLLPGKSHGWRSPVGYGPWGRKESDTTERPHCYYYRSFVCVEGEGGARGGLCEDVHGGWGESLQRIAKGIGRPWFLWKSIHRLCEFFFF